MRLSPFVTATLLGVVQSVPAQQVTREIRSLSSGPRNGAPEQMTRLGGAVIFVAASARTRVVAE